jgi:hypothetical protein
VVLLSINAEGIEKGLGTAGNPLGNKEKFSPSCHWDLPSSNYDRNPADRRMRDGMNECVSAALGAMKLALFLSQDGVQFYMGYVSSSGWGSVACS